MTWLQFNAVQRADGAARSGHFRAKTRAELLTASLALAPGGGHAVPLLHVVALCLFYLADEVVEALMSLSVLDIAELLPIFLWHSHLHLCQCSLLLVHGAAEHFLFSIHVIVSIEIDCLGTCCRIHQVLLHPLVVQLFALILRQTVIVHSKLKLLIGANYARLLGETCFLATRLADHPLMLSPPLATLGIGDSLVNHVRDENRAQGEKAHQGCLFVVVKRRLCATLHAYCSDCVLC